MIVKTEIKGKFECLIRQVSIPHAMSIGECVEIVPAKKGYSIVIHSIIDGVMNYEYKKVTENDDA